MEAEVVAAIVTAFVSLVVAVLGVLDARRRLQKELQKWREELGAKLGSVEVELQRDLNAQRFKAYPEVFRILGTIRDVNAPHPVPGSAKAVRRIAGELLKQLYGEAGLLMEMQTRNALHRAWVACHLFHTEEAVGWRQLQGFFFLARRWLRADLGIKDVDQIETKFDDIWKKYDLGLAEEKIEALRKTALIEGIDLTELVDLGSFRD